MNYRKISADKIFDGYQFLTEHALLITDSGKIEKLTPLKEAGADVETFSGILSPGFINCHCHLELSHMKGLIPERTGLVDFVFKVVTERYHSKEEILAAIARAEDEMLQNGIVAVGDICNNSLTLPQKQKGRLCYYNFIESSGWLPQVSEARFNRSLDLYNEYDRELGIGNLKSAIANRQSIVPHAPYSVSEGLWKQIQPYFENKVVSIHNQETAFEDEFFLSGTGDFNRMYQLMNIDNTHHRPTQKTSLQSYSGKLAKASGIILVHNTFTTQQDVDFLRSHVSPLTSPVSFCLCINANLYIENMVPPIQMLRKNQCTIVLGTDSLASNRSLNIIDEINSIQTHFPTIPLEEILQWATISGAKALEMDKELGSFEKGKEPGINLLTVDAHTNKWSVEKIS